MFTWATFLAFDIRCTLPHMVHPNHSGGILVSWVVSTNHVGTEGLAFGGDRCHPACMRTFKVFNLNEEDNNHWKPLILIMHLLGLHIDLDRLKNKATLYFTPVAITCPLFPLTFLCPLV